MGGYGQMAVCTTSGRTSTTNFEIKKLSDVKELSDFKALYKNNNLTRTRDKISFLRKNLGIVAIRCNQEIAPLMLLAELEGYALTHPWYCK